MLCPRCASMSGVLMTRWRGGASLIVGNIPDTLTMWRKRYCQNERCGHKWLTLELCADDLHALMADVARCAVRDAKESECPA